MLAARLALLYLSLSHRTKRAIAPSRRERVVDHADWPDTGLRHDRSFGPDEEISPGRLLRNHAIDAAPAHGGAQSRGHGGRFALSRSRRSARRGKFLPVWLGAVQRCRSRSAANFPHASHATATRRIPRRSGRRPRLSEAKLDAGPIRFVDLESAVISQHAATLSRDIVGTQRCIIEELEMVPSWSERYETLIEFGRRLAPMPIRLRVHRNRIRDCQGQAW